MMIAKNSVRLLVVSFFFSCVGNAQPEAVSQPKQEAIKEVESSDNIIVGAERMSQYLEQIRNKKVAVVANNTSYIKDKHLVDELLESGVDVVHVYTPEHGFRGNQGAGAHIEDEVDTRTGLRIYSLHGKCKKPSAVSLEGIEVMLFDIQDVGVRFYTYISTLHYVMEACAEANIPLVILDRPNPNMGHEPDGPVLEPSFSSFIGMHQIPVIHGLTIGEYGLMINGQGWLKDRIRADLSVIACEGYSRSQDYMLPIAPSPNLPNQKSIYLYPSLCFFEGTAVSIGRGTEVPFQIVGHPGFKSGSYSFTPQANSVSKHPKLDGERCFGIALSEELANAMHQQGELDLTLLIHFYEELGLGASFFREDGFFDLLAGTSQLREQIQLGMSEEEIRTSWQEDLVAYKEMYRKYWIYE